jgi:transglutaminase-like putative cysteine protease
MHYNTRHITRLRYSQPIRETVMVAHLQPRNTPTQHCLEFKLQSVPKTISECYLDALGNWVHHLSIGNEHNQVVLVAEGLVEVTPRAPLPTQLAAESWSDLAVLATESDYWEFFQPSTFTQPTELLTRYIAELQLTRLVDPLTTVLAVNRIIHYSLYYTPKSTHVDSPIDDALSDRCGVCQDYTHIMLAVLRLLGVPCRYVSGYIFHRSSDLSIAAEGASHAWVEVYLPDLGWVGFDPTNNLVVSDRHIVVAVGRDYADVPPTKGIFKGDASSQLTVNVRVSHHQVSYSPIETDLVGDAWLATESNLAAEQQQQQQQQQQ